MHLWIGGSIGGKHLNWPEEFAQVFLVVNERLLVQQKSNRL